jgi:diguanylate cyclase (GGDEF)-like protein
MVHDPVDSRFADKSVMVSPTFSEETIKPANSYNHTLKAFLVVIVCALAGTLMMYFLDAYEKLYVFGRAYPKYGFEEVAVFLPSFLCLGLLLFSYRQILDLKKEMQRRKAAEKVISENEQRFRALSITDSLTRLYNQRHFYQKLADEIDRASRYDKPLSLLFMDIDNFKRYNDKYGHIEGDKALVQLSNTIFECMRNIDLGFRYGGEEFSLILPETSQKGAIAVAERIRSKFAAKIFYPNENDVANVTVSIGVTYYLPGEMREQFVRRADRNMYLAKKNGKNRTYATDSSETAPAPEVDCSFFNTCMEKP